MKKKITNKAVSDSISALLKQGVNVNIRIETATYAKLIFLAVIIAGLFAATSYALYHLKK